MATSFPLDLAGKAAMSSFEAGNAVGGAALPGYMTSMGNIGNNIASATAGQVPDDVLALLKQQGAEGNVGTGRAGNSAYLRALGLTSLGLQDQGQKNFQSILETLPGFGISQNPMFQVSAPLAHESGVQAQVWNRQDDDRMFAVQQQQLGLNAAKAGLGTGYTGGGSGDPWGSMTSNAWSPYNPWGTGR